MPKRWVVINGTDESAVDLSKESARQWERFCDWRDRATGHSQ